MVTFLFVLDIIIKIAMVIGLITCTCAGIYLCREYKKLEKDEED